MAEKEPAPPLDRSEPSEARKAELRAAYQEGSDAPYKGVWIKTLGELEWICAERDWSGEWELPAGKTRPKLRGANLSGVKLSGANLFGATLDKADLRGATLSGADLSRATLSGAYLGYATLSGAYLRYATLSGAGLFMATLDKAYLNNATLSGADLRGAMLSGADLSEATLSGADLSLATLSGADLSQATLSGANLRECRMDSDTTVTEVILSATTRIADVKWNGVTLTRVDWQKYARRPKQRFWQRSPLQLGDEEAAEQLPRSKRDERRQAYREAERAYHLLAVALKDQGLNDDASAFRVREYRMKRRALFAERRYGAWMFECLLNALAARGEKPERAFIAYVLVNGAFSFAYWLLAHFHLTQEALPSWDSPLVLSITSFHGRVFFAGGLPITDWVARVGAIEAAVGLLIEIVFISTFSRRFLGD